MGLGNIWDKFEKQIDILAQPEQPKTAISVKSKAEVKRQLAHWRGMYERHNQTQKQKAIALTYIRELEAEMKEFDQYRENYGKRDYATTKKIRGEK